MTDRTRPHTYDVGDRLQMDVEILHPTAGTPFDPASVVCTVRDGGATSKPDVTKVEAGIYRAEHVIASEENGAYAWDAFDEEGKQLSATEVEFRVRDRIVPR